MKDFFTRYERHILPEPNSGCWLWTGAATGGGPDATCRYGFITYRRKFFYAHRCAYEAVHGDGSADGWLIRHACDVPCCVNPSHLSIGTRKDNARDMVERGRSLRGERANGVKLTGAAVLDILIQGRWGAHQSSLGAQFGVHQTAIHLILLGKRWGHIKEKAMNVTAKTSPTLTRMIGRERRALRRQKRALTGAAYERCWLALCGLTELQAAPMRPGLAEQVAMNIMRARI